MATVGFPMGPTGASSSGTQSSSGSDPIQTQDPAQTKEQFISLLVAQLKNQDPLNPADGTQFLSQLTEINSFEQLLGIRQDLDQISNKSASSTSGSGSQS